MEKEPMDMGSPKTPEEIAKSRNDYERIAKREAKKYSSLTEKLTGEGLTKETVIESDAYFENELRNLTKTRGLSEKFVEKLVQAFSESHLEIDTKKLDEIKGYYYHYDGERYPRFAVTLKGKVKDQDVELTVNSEVAMDDWDEEHDFNKARRNVKICYGGSKNILSAKINGIEIPHDVAALIWKKYYETHSDRIDALLETKEEIKNKREKEKLNKAD